VGVGAGIEMLWAWMRVYVVRVKIPPVLSECMHTIKQNIKVQPAVW